MTAALELLRNVFGRVCDTVKVWFINGLAIFFIYFHRIDPRLAIDFAVGAVTIAYTIWRWRRDWKTGK